jgi:hypothetical protein
MFDNVRNVENGSIVTRDFFVVRQEEMTAGSTSCLGFTEITGVAVDGKFHVAAFIGEDSFFLRCEVIG